MAVTVKFFHMIPPCALQSPSFLATIYIYIYTICAFLPAMYNCCCELTCFTFWFTLLWKRYPISSCIPPSPSKWSKGLDWNCGPLFSGYHTLSHRIPVLRDVHNLKISMRWMSFIFISRAWCKTN